MGMVRYILSVFWGEAGMIARITTFVLVGLPAGMALAVGVFGWSWSKDTFPWWGWLGLTIIGVLSALLFTMAKRARRIEGPKVRIDYENAFPFVYEQPPESEDLCFRHVSIRIKNIGNEMLNKCVVEIASVKDKNGVEHVHIPGSLGRRQTGNEVFPLRPDQEKFVNLVKLDETDNGSPIILEFWQHKFQTKQYSAVPRGQYDLKVRVFSENCKSVEQIFKLTVTNEGKLSVLAAKQKLSISGR